MIQLRNKYQYCPHKIQGILLNHYKIKVGHMTVYRILCKRGLNNHPISKPRKKRKYIRFERKFPNELWQIDLKVIESEGIWLISIFDDHSRFVLSSIKYMEGTSNKIIYLLKRTIRKYGKPLQILTDHGSQFYNSHSKLQ